MTTVMFVGHTAKASGGEIALLRLVPALGPSVRSLVVLGEDGPLVPLLREAGAEVLVLPLGGDTRDVRKDSLSDPLVALSQLGAVLRYAWRLRRLLRERRVDVLHANSLKAGVYGCLAARLAGVPSIWHVRDRIAEDYLPRPAVWAVRLATVLLPTRVLTNSRATKSTLSPRLARLLGRSAVLAPEPVPDPIDTTGIVPADRTAEDDGVFRVALVGRFSPWKGQLVAVRAFAAADLGPDARLALIGAAMFGEDEYEREVRAEIRRLGLEDRVELPGFVSDVLGALRSVDVLVHSSTIPEPFGQVVLEGLAAGVPVVATREGGPGEIITDRVDGLLYPAGDVAALAAALCDVNGDDGLRARLVKAGRVRVEDYAPGVVGAAVTAVYDQVCRRTREASR